MVTLETMKYLNLLMFSVFFVCSVNAEVVFEGKPIKKITTSYQAVQTNKIDSKEAKELNKTVISKIGDKYKFKSKSVTLFPDNLNNW